MKKDPFSVFIGLGVFPVFSALAETLLHFTITTRSWTFFCILSGSNRPALFTVHHQILPSLGISTVFRPPQCIEGHVMRDVLRLQLGHFLSGLFGFTILATFDIHSPLISRPPIKYFLKSLCGPVSLSNTLQVLGGLLVPDSV
jgi:hypothetical protein